MTESDDKVAGDKIKGTASIEKLRKVNAAANYCYECNRCVNVCPVAFLDIFNPRELITDLTFLTPEEALKNNDIWKCLTCGLCSIYCPMTKDKTGVNFTEIIKDLRSLASEYKPLQDTLISCNHERVYSSLPKLMAEDKIEFTNKIGFLEGTGLKTTDKGEIGYFMGCVPFLTGAAPCVVGCPAGVDVQGYVSLIAE
ncbi:unnamed protein product, partial [marine sediment metagenome]